MTGPDILTLDCSSFIIFPTFAAATIAFSSTPPPSTKDLENDDIALPYETNCVPNVPKSLLFPKKLTTGPDMLILDCNADITFPALAAAVTAPSSIPPFSTNAFENEATALPKATICDPKVSKLLLFPKKLTTGPDMLTLFCNSDIILPMFAAFVIESSSIFASFIFLENEAIASANAFKLVLNVSIDESPVNHFEIPSTIFAPAKRTNISAKFLIPVNESSSMFLAPITKP